jgi:hypothetical protein
MKSVLMVLAIASLVGLAFAQPETKELVINGKVESVAAKDNTLRVQEIPEAPPPENPKPGAMQSGVVRPFVVTEETKLMSKGESISLADIRAGDRVTIHYVLDSGKNVATRITVTAGATD